MPTNFRVFLFAITFAVPSHSYADETTGHLRSLGSPGSPRLEYGLRLGVNSNTLVGEDAGNSVVETRQAVRFVADGFVQLGISSWFQLQPELLYSSKGTDFEVDEVDDGGLYFSYFEFQALARIEAPWRLNTWRKVTVRPYIVIGPWAAVLVSAKSVSPGFEPRSIKDAIKDFDYGVAAGLGVAAEPVWWGAVELSARYVVGIPQIGNPNDELEQDDAKHRTVSVMLGFRCCAHRKKSRTVEEAALPAEPAPAEMVPVDLEPDESSDSEELDEDSSEEPAEIGPGEAGDSP